MLWRLSRDEVEYMADAIGRRYERQSEAMKSARDGAASGAGPARGPDGGAIRNVDIGDLLSGDVTKVVVGREPRPGAG